MPQENIDWEQRRYEIARELYVHYSQLTPEVAVARADRLIAELKKEKE